MRQTIKSFFSLSRNRVCIGFILLVFLTGCTPPAEPDGNTLRIGLAIYDQEDTFISTVMQQFDRAARELEAELEIKVNISVANASKNQTLQNGQIENLLKQDIDVLCINIVDRTAAAVIIDKAKQDNIPIIFFNRQPVDEDIRRWNQVFYIGSPAAQSGEIQAEIVYQAWTMDDSSIDKNKDGILQYLMLEGEPGHQDALLRTQTSISRITELGVTVEKLAGDTANWNRAQAHAKVLSWISEFGNQIEVIFSNNDDMALGAIDAYLECGISPLPMIVGVDATPPAQEAILNGNLSGTARNDAMGLAKSMMQLSSLLWQGKNPASHLNLEDECYIWLPYEMITAENIADFLQD